jgi:putative transposase
VHAYCLLTNHYHLLLHTPHGALSSAMQRCASRFTLATNRRHGRDGPIFRGRFKSVLVEDDSQLTHLTRYIHRNPVEARLVTRPEARPWSSAGAYVGTAVAPEWLYTASVLAMFGGSTAAYLRRCFRPGPHRPVVMRGTPAMLLR